VALCKGLIRIISHLEINCEIRRWIVSSGNVRMCDNFTQRPAANIVIIILWKLHTVVLANAKLITKMTICDFKP